MQLTFLLDAVVFLLDLKQQEKMETIWEDRLMTKKFTTVRSLLNALAKAMNLINPEMENHHQETAYLAYQLGDEMGLPTEERHMIVVSALLHDVGTIVMPQRENLSEIESHRREIAQIGAEMIRDLLQAL